LFQASEAGLVPRHDERLEAVSPDVSKNDSFRRGKLGHVAAHQEPLGLRHQDADAVDFPHDVRAQARLVNERPVVLVMEIHLIDQEIDARDGHREF